MIRPPVVGLSVLLAALLGAAGLRADGTADRAPRPAAAGPRRVYVLHSGLHLIPAHPWKNAAAQWLGRGLAERGVAEADLVVLDNPFPTATWRDVIPRDGLLMYLDALDPGSAFSRDAYLRLDAALKAHAVTDRDEIIWVGHSAGGQVGMTLASLASHLNKYPELAAQARPYRFKRVITLGTGVGANAVPPEVELRHYYSSADGIVGFLVKHGTLMSEKLGHEARFCPSCDLGPNGKLRVFSGVGHGAWKFTPRVLDCILRETEPDTRPAWRRLPTEGQPGPGLAQILAGALEHQCRISLEDPPAQ